MGVRSHTLGPWEALSLCVPAGVLVALAVMMLTKTKCSFSQLWKSSRWARPEPPRALPWWNSGCEIQAEGLWFLKEWHFYQGFKELYPGANLSKFKRMHNFRKTKHNSKNPVLKNGTLEGKPQVEVCPPKQAGHRTCWGPKWPPGGSKDIGQRRQSPLWVYSLNHLQRTGERNEKGERRNALKEQPRDLGSRHLKETGLWIHSSDHATNVW